MTGLLSRAWIAFARWVGMHRDRPGVPRLILHAYVCGIGCVRYTHQEGSSLLAEIFIHRPEGCRYAVATVAGTDTVWVIDMYTCGFDQSTRCAYLGDYVAYASVEAAVMATALTYEPHFL